MTGKTAARALRLGLPVEGELDLAPLPGAEAGRADEDGHRAAAGDALLQGGEPGLAGGRAGRGRGRWRGRRT